MRLSKKLGIVGMGGAGFPTTCKAVSEGTRRRLITSLQTVLSVSHISQQTTEECWRTATSWLAD